MEFNLKNYEVYSFRLEKYLNKKFYMVFKKESFWKKLKQLLCRQQIYSIILVRDNMTSKFGSACSVDNNIFTRILKSILKQ